MPSGRKKIQANGKLDIDDINKGRLEAYLDLRNIAGMSREMASALIENGIRNASYIPSSDPLEMYDKMRDQVKSRELSQKWTHLDYRHQVMNGLMLAAIKYMSFDPDQMARVDALCPAGQWVNELNGITRVTAFILVSIGIRDLSELTQEKAIYYYREATKSWVLSKLEGLDFYNSVTDAKMLLDPTYTGDESGPSNPNGP